MVSEIRFSLSTACTDAIVRYAVVCFGKHFVGFYVSFRIFGFREVALMADKEDLAEAHSR